MSHTTTEQAGRTGEPLELRRLANTSEMVDRPGFLMRRLIPKFDRVGFDLRFVSRVHEAARRGRVVYVCDRQSTLDYLYFNYAFLKFSLPLAWFANGVGTLLFRPLFAALGYLFRRLFRRVHGRLDEQATLAAGVRAGRASLLFLRRRRALVQWGGENVLDHLRTLVTLQKELDEPILLLPQAVFWEMDPEKYRRSLLDLFFGALDAPGRIRKLVGFLRNFQRAFVQMGEPVDLKALVAQNPDASVEALAEQLRWALQRDLVSETRPIRGPILKRSRRIRDEILRNESFRATLQAQAEDMARPAASVEREVSGYLREIASDFSIRYVEGICLGLTVLWNRIFSGLEIDMAGINRIREVAKEAPVLLVPAHRSHLDYLAISYFFYMYGLIPPHIVAGINLSFWPLGHIFRRAGAFFIRRSFRGNRLYTIALAQYVRKLVKEGYWIEFFIEGGRSRTGKCLPPKLGLLSQVVDAVLDGAARDVYFVPASIGYERVVEEGSYSRELAGAEKQSENLTALLRTTRVLGSRYGRMHVRFGEPISLRSFLGTVDASSGEAVVRREITRLGHRLIEGINRTTVITTSSLVTTALLCHPKRGISRDDLLMRVGLLLGIATRAEAPLASALRLGLLARRIELARAEERAEQLEGEGGAPVPRYQRQRLIDRARGEAVRESVDRVLGQLVGQKRVRVETFDGEPVYSTVDDARINLDMYKNAYLHLVVPHAFAATAILAEARDGRVEERSVRRTVRFLSRLLKYEFNYVERAAFDEAYEQTKRFFLELGLLEPEGTPGVLRIHPKAHHLLRFFRNLISNFLESYRIVTSELPSMLGTPCTEKELLKRLQQHARRAFHEGELGFRESVSSVNFQNAIQFFEDRGFVVREPAPSGRPLLRSVVRPVVLGRWATLLRRLVGEHPAVSGRRTA